MDELHLIINSKYFYVLVSLVAYFIISPFLIANVPSDFILSVMFSTIVVFSINITTKRKYLLLCTVTLGVASLIGYWNMSLLNPPHEIFIIHYLVNVLFLGVITYAVITSVASQKRITHDTLFGAISGYLLLGFFWSYIYLSIDSLNPQAFSDHATVISIRDKAQHYIYYSFVTLTTLGYGDILATSAVARAFSWLEAVVGQIYLAVWISQLVGLRIAQKNAVK